jgi:hypothetical protein
LDSVKLQVGVFFWVCVSTWISNSHYKHISSSSPAQQGTPSAPLWFWPKNQRAFRSILSSNHHQVKFTLLVKYTTVHHSFISLPPSLLTSAMTIISTQCFIHDILTQQSEWSQKIVYLIVHLLCLNPPDSFRQNPDLFPGYHG